MDQMHEYLIEDQSIDTVVLRRSTRSKRNKHNKRKHKLPLTAYLSYLVVSTMLFTGITFSSYVTTTNGSDSARVAKFEVIANAAAGQANSFSLTNNNATAEYSFEVKSNSEVAVTYDVLVSWEGTWPAGATIALDHEGTAVTPSGTSHTFSKADSFVAAGGTNIHKLIIKETKFSSATDSLAIKVDVIASQVD